jgi:hypothetical protein
MAQRLIRRPKAVMVGGAPQQTDRRTGTDRRDVSRLNRPRRRSRSTRRAGRRYCTEGARSRRTSTMKSSRRSRRLHIPSPAGRRLPACNPKARRRPGSTGCTGNARWDRNCSSSSTGWIPREPPYRIQSWTGRRLLECRATGRAGATARSLRFLPRRPAGKTPAGRSRSHTGRFGWRNARKPFPHCCRPHRHLEGESCNWRGRAPSCLPARCRLPDRHPGCRRIRRRYLARRHHRWIRPRSMRPAQAHSPSRLSHRERT